MARSKMESNYLEEAFNLLDSVKGKPQTLAERKKTTTELAGNILNEANRTMSRSEKKNQAQLSRLMHDVSGKAFTTAMTDQCFRSDNKSRIANQMCYLLDTYGIPDYLSFFNRLGLFAFKLFGRFLPQLFVPAAVYLLRKESSKVILPGEEKELDRHIENRTHEGVKHNLNHLGEAIISEQEAHRKLELYLKDLEKPNINYVSIKISTIYSQINLLAWEYSVEKISEKLRKLYRSAIKNASAMPDGSKRNKFINLDMEEYRDLHLTVEVFKKVLDEPEFHNLSAGIVLQAYIPDSFAIQKELTEWAQTRIKNGGAPIKIRIVKGANLAMEQVEASIRTWPQSPYTSKLDTDANYKRMVIFGCIPENARAVHLGIASHNIFDIAFAMLLRKENQVEAYTEFEMLEGMADHI
jgi:RHH-type transcriptional regulator, proline utilization regulon repressor / proline dehydrogenase / delta 1-pyrroline-5-carboxylate dehydrogenase